MSEEEGFLKRWSRRKRDAVEPVAPPEPPESAPTDAVPPAASPAEPPALPPVDAIGPETDITAFLKPDVPAALSQAALRRAWSADPAIRDFVGLSENSWDFTAVGGVPGFGPIKPEDVARLLEQLLAPPKEAPPEAEAGPAPDSAQPALPPERPVAASQPAAPYKVNAATRDETPEGEPPAEPGRRRHGGALPD